MEELLQKLLEAEILTEDTKKDLEQAFKGQLNEAISAARAETAAEVRLELTEQWIKERETLIEAIDSRVGEYLEDEVAELREDIDRFRDLEAEYAEKLVEAKKGMSGELKRDLKDLVEKIDKFLEIRMAAEIEELKEDIDAARRNEFGRKIFEAFATEYAFNYKDERETQATLREVVSRLKTTERQLKESESVRVKLERDKKMSAVLAPLSNHPRAKEVMEAILRNVDTKNLEEGYKTFIGRVLRETSEEVGTATDKGSMITESKKSPYTPNTSAKPHTYKYGNVEDLIAENVSGNSTKTHIEHLRKLAGIS